MSWRDDEYTEMEKALSAEVNRLRQVCRELERENQDLRSKPEIIKNKISFCPFWSNDQCQLKSNGGNR